MKATRKDFEAVAELVSELDRNTFYFAHSFAERLGFFAHPRFDARRYYRAAGCACPKCKTGVLVDIGMGIDVCDACHYNSYIDDKEDDPRITDAVLPRAAFSAGLKSAKR